MSETFEYENLFAGCQKPAVNRPGTVRTFEAFSRGQLVGKLTATGKWQVMHVADKANFSDFGIAVEAVDTTSGVERNTSIYTEGEFNENAVLYPYSETADDWRETLVASGIYLRKAVTTEGV